MSTTTTAYENAEKKRVADHEAAINEILKIGMGPFGTTNEIRESIAQVGALYKYRDFEEFDGCASGARITAAIALGGALVASEKRDAEIAEALRLRAENEKQEAVEAANAAKLAEEQRRLAIVEAEQYAAEIVAREADASHRFAIHTEILEALIAAGVSHHCAVLAGKAIIARQIPNVKVVYWSDTVP